MTAQLDSREGIGAGIDDSLTADRLSRFLLAAGALAIPPVLALGAVYVFFRSPLIGLCGAALAVDAALIFLALNRARRGRVDQAISLYVIATLLYAVALGLGGLRFFAMAALSGLLALVVPVAYVSGERLRNIAIVTALAISASAVPSFFGFVVATDPLPEEVIAWILVLGVPSIVGVLTAAMWQSRLALSESSKHLSNMNAALRESERLLEEKVVRRTQALQDSRTDLAQARDEAVAANRHKSAFLANMSHELRTPLNAIIGFSEVLLEKVFGELNDKQTEYMGDIHDSGKHLLSLINDVLDLSKIEAGRLELSPATVELSVTFENAMVLMRERALRGGIKLVTEIEPDIGTVVADERKLKQVLINLLSNAVKFTKEGGSVTLRATREGSDLEISVIDTGIGIAAEDHTHIFEEFRQAGDDPSSLQEGTGLGLALTKRLVELHRGKIWLESALDQGSRFTFRLPKGGPATISVLR